MPNMLANFINEKQVYGQTGLGKLTASAQDGRINFILTGSQWRFE